jgi:hypothetical protein
MSALREHAEVLPVLQYIFFGELQPSEPLQEAIGQLITTRRLSGHTVTVHVNDTIGKKLLGYCRNAPEEGIILQLSECLSGSSWVLNSKICPRSRRLGKVSAT